MSARSLRIALALVAAATLLGGPAAAQDAGPTLGGYSGIAQADGLHALYNPAGLLPIAAPVDFGAPDAYVTIASGPATFARASAADPGDLLANPGALLANGVPGYQAGTVPAYPYRAVASSGTNPSAESSPGPGLDARATADDTGSSATATMPLSSAPAIASFGTMSATATTTTDGATVTVHARSEISDLNLLGVLTIGSVVTDLSATSDGTTTDTSGGTVVTNGSVLGMPVDIDAGGVKPASSRTASTGTTTTNPVSGLLGTVVSSLLGADGSLNGVLANAGIHVTVAGPVKTGTPNATTLTAGGLRIDLELSPQTFPALKTLLDAVPFIPNPIPGTPGVGDVISVAEARHLVTVGAARGVVSLTATASQPFAGPATSNASGTAGRATNTAPHSPPSRPALSTAAPSLVAAAPAASDRVREATPISIGEGVGALALLALLAQPFIGNWLARGSASLLAADGAGTCPFEVIEVIDDRP